MARIRAGVRQVGIREVLESRLERKAAAPAGDRRVTESGVFVSPWPRLLEQLRSGGRVVVPAWWVPRTLRKQVGVSSSRVAVSADGFIEEVS